jgi:hypothetical protein
MFFSKLMELENPNGRFSYALMLCLSGIEGTLMVQLIIPTVIEKVGQQAVFGARQELAPPPRRGSIGHVLVEDGEIRDRLKRLHLLI